jgi:A/G-specific adenine glycosylase
VLIARTNSGEIMLDKRAEKGIWAGLYALPMFESYEALVRAIPNADPLDVQTLNPFLHVLTHKDLHLHPVLANVTNQWIISETTNWYQREQWSVLGLPTPVRNLLTSLI